MTVPHTLSIVTLGVADVARSVAFYRALGWRQASSSMPEIAWFDLGGPWLGLFGAEALAEDAGGSAAPAGHGAGEPAAGRGRVVTLALNVRGADAVDAALAEAVAAGATLAKPATRADWGGYSGYFADPDGHLWEVAHNPGFPVLEDGRTVIP